MKTDAKQRRGITRIDRPESNAVGWMARIQRGKERKHEFYSDKDCGGARKAKTAALRQVERWRRDLPAAETSHRGVLTARNKSGEINLHRREAVSKANPESVYSFWVGQWIGARGQRGTKAFSCNKYTEQGAKDLALIARDLRIADLKRVFREYRKRHGPYPKDWESGVE